MNNRNNLDGRDRDENGRIRAKNGDTHVETLRKIYGENFLPGTRSDAKLDTVLKKTGEDSLSELVKNKKYFG